MEPEDGGIDVPDNTDGITRYPSMDGAPIPPDDIDDGSPKDDNGNGDKDD